jgi:hypothetical protein
MVTKGDGNQKIAFLAHGMPWLNHPELKVGTTPKVFIRNNGTMYALRASAMTSTVLAATDNASGIAGVNWNSFGEFYDLGKNTEVIDFDNYGNILNTAGQTSNLLLVDLNIAPKEGISVQQFIAGSVKTLFEVGSAIYGLKNVEKWQEGVPSALKIARTVYLESNGLINASTLVSRVKVGTFNSFINGNTIVVPVGDARGRFAGYPAVLNDQKILIGVGGTDVGGQSMSYFSSGYKDEMYSAGSVLVVAPSELVYFASASNSDIVSDMGNVTAASLVGGTVSLMQAANGSLLPEDYREIIRRTSVKQPSIHGDSAYAVFGGYGLLNAGRAVHYTKDREFELVVKKVQSSFKKDTRSITLIDNLWEPSNKPSLGTYNNTQIHSAKYVYSQKQLRSYLYDFDVWPVLSLSKGVNQSNPNDLRRDVQVSVNPLDNTITVTSNAMNLSGSHWFPVHVDSLKLAIRIAKKLKLAEKKTNATLAAGNHVSPGTLFTGTTTVNAGARIEVPAGKIVSIWDSFTLASNSSSASTGNPIDVFGTMYIEDSTRFTRGYITVKNGGKVVVRTKALLTDTYISVANGGTIEMDGVTYKGSASSAINSDGRVTIKNSTFQKSGTASFPYVALNGAGASGSVFENVTITGSTYGIHCYNAGFITLTNIVGDGNWGQVVKLTSTGALVDGGSFSNSTWDGIAMYEGGSIQIKGSPSFTNNYIGIRAARGSYAYFGHGWNEPANMSFSNHSHSGVAAYTNSGVDLGIGVGDDFMAGHNYFDNAVRQVYVRQNSYVRSFATTLAGTGILDGEAGSVIDLEYQDPFSPPGGGPLKLNAETDPLVWLEEQPVRSAKAMQVYHSLQRKPEQKERVRNVIKHKVDELNHSDWTVPAMLEAQREGRETDAVELALRVTKGKTFSADDQKSAWYLLFRAAVDANNKAEARKALRELKKLKHEDAENGFCDLLLEGASADENPKSEIAHPKSVVSAHPNPFNPSTTLTVTLSRAENITLAVYDINGRRIMELASGAYQQGVHTFRFNASHLASGMYLWRLQTTAGIQTGKITLLK